MAAALVATSTDKVCLRQVLEHFYDLLPYHLLPHSDLDADSAVAGCVQSGFFSWGLGFGSRRLLLFCAPKLCRRRYLLVEIVPLLLQQWSKKLDLNFSAFNDTDLERMQPISSLKLDFIIAGYCHSGTSTLHELLRSHPDVDMPSHEVHELHFRNSYSQRDLRSLSSLQKEKVCGLRSTWAATDRRVMQRLSRIPSLVAVVLIRDPLSQLDSILSQGTTAFFNPLGQEIGMELLRTATNVLYFAQDFVADGRVLLVPSVQLSRTPQQVYDQVCKWLGLRQGQIGGYRRFHTRPGRFPVRSPQSLCDVDPEWRPPIAELPENASLRFLDLLDASLARERVRQMELLRMVGWGAPLLENFNCDRTTSRSKSDDAAALGMPGGFCSVVASMVRSGSLPADCPVGRQCVACCVEQQGACSFDRSCCAPVMDILWRAAGAAVRRAFCGHATNGKEGCCTRFLQTP
eukprot:TRINITY_DN29279_c0_g1_i2.p1 TRINITY_DN29279_c0_g1~~TRINITY_DN29279_c0_g1_i2.p1  ORF type:complete len:460 (+),score=77.93 TRINITY_DN29279_c0_g1_i2:221-1600(+)